MSNPGGSGSRDEKQVIRAADRHVMFNAPGKALQEYQKLLEAGSRDVRVLQALGECYAQQNDLERAGHFFTRVAESHRSGGFLLQAEALYERVLSSRPDLADVHRALAALQRELGLTSEADAHERIAASRQEPLPEEVASKLRQAESLVSAGRKKEACQELAQVVEDLQRQQRTEVWRRVAERLTSLEWNRELTNALARHYLSQGDRQGALNHLPFPLDSVDDETQTLVDEFDRLTEENARLRAAARRSARSPYDDAMRKHGEAPPKDFRVLQELCELHLQQGDRERAVHFLTLAAGCHEADGFLLRAVACHERVLGLIPMPRQVDPGRDLARLHQALGVKLQSAGTYQSPAAHYEGTEGTESISHAAPFRAKWVSTELEIKPEDIERAERTRAAARQLMAKAKAAAQGSRPEHVQRPVWQDLAVYLQRHMRTEDWLREAEQRSALEPENTVLARQLAQQYLLRGDPERAVARLGGGAQPGEADIETMTLLAHAFEKLGQPEKAAALHGELVRMGAARRFAQAAEDFKRDNRLEDWLFVAARLNALAPEQQALAAELAHEVLRRGNDRDLAVALVKVAFKSDGGAGEMLSLLSQHFARLGQREKLPPIRQALDDMTAGMFRV